MDNRIVLLSDLTKGIVPAVILIIFLGVFGLFTAKLLIDFKLNHPEVHNMGRHIALELRRMTVSFLLHRRCRNDIIRANRTRGSFLRYDYIRHFRCGQ